MRFPKMLEVAKVKRCNVLLSVCLFKYQAFVYHCRLHQDAKNNNENSLLRDRLALYLEAEGPINLLETSRQLYCNNNHYIIDKCIMHFHRRLKP